MSIPRALCITWLPELGNCAVSFYIAGRDPRGNMADAERKRVALNCIILMVVLQLIQCDAGCIKVVYAPTDALLTGPP